MGSSGAIGETGRRSEGAVDAWAELDGPIGTLYIAWGPAGITTVERAGDASGFEFDAMLRTGRPVTRVPRIPRDLAGKITRQLAGEWRDDLPLDFGGLTAFAAATLRHTMRIPWGEVRPYAWVAREIGRPRAVRAVGTALGNNPLPFVIPCHRVVRADGRVGEYGAGGPTAKRAMLESEGVDPDHLEALADDGIRYLGDEATSVFCYPTCHRVRRVAARRTVRFRDGGDARDAGFDPCPDCRPLETAVFGLR
jgi:O-6-methylguanine DNA methyltransferase